MPRRSFDDSYWGDPFVQELNKDAKLLFAYLWTNKRCNSAGLYEITPKTIAFETGIEIKDLPSLLNELSAKVNWLADDNLIWVRNFLKHQPKSPQFLKSVADCLSRISSNGVVKEYLDYYGMLGVSIPYQYHIDSVGGGYGDIQEQELEPELVIELELDKGEKFDVFRNRMKVKFSTLDIDEEYEKFKLYWSEGKRKLKRPKFAFANWLKKAVEIQTGKGLGKNAGVNKINSDDPDKYVKGKYGHMVRR